MELVVGRMVGAAIDLNWNKARITLANMHRIEYEINIMWVELQLHHHHMAFWKIQDWDRSEE